MRARAAGKASVARKTAWVIQIGTLSIRCRRTPGLYIVEAKFGALARWEIIGMGANSTELFSTAVLSKFVNDELHGIAGKISTDEP